MSARRRTSIQAVLGRTTVHPFPARMAPSLVIEAMSPLKPGATIVDPMAGSGTVLALARAGGHRAIGFDVDPLAVLIAKVWTKTIDPDLVRSSSHEVLGQARKIFLTLSVSDAYPTADRETQAFVRYWFDPYSRRQLRALAIAVSRAETSMRETLWCAFSRLIITKQSGASRAMDLSHSRPHRAFNTAPRKPFAVFADSVERVIEGCLHRKCERAGPIARIDLADARRLPMADASADLVFTSPPYLNAIDYLRCSKFTLVWMGYTIADIRKIRSNSIGTEVGGEGSALQDGIYKRLRFSPPLAPRTTGILNRYIADTQQALSEARRVLARNGRAVYVVGENTIRGTFIPTGKLIAYVAEESGLTLVDRRVRSLPNERRYLPPPGSGKNSFDVRMRREVILTFKRK